jgi:hypothetical protein
MIFVQGEVAEITLLFLAQGFAENTLYIFLSRIKLLFRALTPKSPIKLGYWCVGDVALFRFECG